MESRKVNIEIALESIDYFRIGEAIEYKKLFKYASKYELIDRLYRRYVRYEDVGNTRQIVARLFDEMQFEKGACRTFFEAYDYCVEDMEEYKHKYNEIKPIRIVNVTGINTDTSPIPDYMWYINAEEEIPLEDYDNLEGDPLWMRPEYMIEKYG